MQEFNYLNLHTVYKCSGEFSESTGYDGDYCFRKIFNNGESLGDREITEKYVITTYKGIDYLADSRKNNACIFGTEEIRKHLEIAKTEIHPFKYQIEETRVYRAGRNYPCLPGCPPGGSSAAPAPRPMCPSWTPSPSGWKDLA